MDRLKKSRRPLRTQLTKAIRQCEEILEAEVVDKSKLETKLVVMRTLMDDMEEKDAEIATQMLDDDVPDGEQDAEYEEVVKYKESYLTVKNRIEKVLAPSRSPTGSDFDTASQAGSALSTNKTRNFKLPKIELKKFNGDLKQWLGWWSQFIKIHEDEGLHDSDKFQYLSNAMEPGTEAAEMVDSYPQTATNYPKVVEALQERFGRQDLLLQVYVRELLTLVISNVTSGKKTPLANLYLKLESHLRSLQALKLSNADPATWLFPLVESSLSEETLRAWQRSSYSKEDGSQLNPPKTKLDFLMEFIKNEVRSEQQILLAQTGFQMKTEKTSSKPKAQKVKPEEISTAAGLTTGQISKCGFCDRNHDTDRCVSALAMSMESRRSLVKEKRLCFQCLKGGHSSKTCRAPVKCAVCGGKHYPVICPKIGSLEDSGKSSKIKPAVSSEDNSTEIGNLTLTEPAQRTAQNVSNCSKDVLLNTLWVTLLGGDKPLRIRLVGDNCSQRSYIRSDALKKIKKNCVGEEWIQNVVFGATVTKPQSHGRYKIQLRPIHGTQVETMELLEKKEICGALPQVPFGPWIEELKAKGVELNDLGSGCKDVDILIGNDLWGTLLTCSPIVKLEGGLYAQETIFGWTLGGRLPKVGSNIASVVTTMVSTTQDLSQLWSLEAIGISDPIERKSAEEAELEAQAHFDKTVQRDEEGRYVVALPWKTDNVDLPTNRNVAQKRLMSATQRLKKTGKWKNYDKVFSDWEAESLITTVTDDKDDGHFLPHRPVYKNSSSTPVRPVFDASCRGSNQQSLNDCLHKGPNLLEKIPAHLSRFREENIGVTSDIRKAFQMLKVREQDKNYQNFLWWEDETCRKIKIYRHDRVVFGENCSPFLLEATIQHHLNLYNSEAALKMKKSWYVDNLCTSVKSMEQYHTFKDEATAIMRSAKMELRQWAHSFQDMSGISLFGNKKCGLDMNESDPSTEKETRVMVLGIVWDRATDKLSCQVKDFEVTSKVTKRQILSVVSQLFDPLGFLSPATLLPKVILQETWTKSFGWDDPLPLEISKKFNSWVEESKLLRDLWIPRHIQLSNPVAREIHVFVDASSLSYASILFMRTECQGQVMVTFLAAKSRLAPIKGSTIPRLELLSCLLGARMWYVVSDAIDMVGVTTHFWTDSTTALAWIQRDIECGVFVNNRRKEIRKLTQAEQWAHVPGVNNPADLPSRGCTPRQLLECLEWREGPSWLKLSRDMWPVSAAVPNEEEISKEYRKTNVSLSLITDFEPHYWSYETNVHVWGWIYRYYRKLKKENQNSGDLTEAEIRKGEVLLLRQVQQDSFENGKEMVGGIQVKKDKDGLLRVVTRLTNRKDTEDFIAPVILPKNHPITEMLIMNFHRQNRHAGISVIMSKLREKYWILQSRRTIRRVLGKCVLCRRYNAKPMEVQPASLPEKRVKDSEPFETTGVDLAGPLFLRDGTKAWIVLFTCAVYRCVHLDLVTSCSSEAFLGALERFIADHGRPNTIFSDNGCNFVGSDTIFAQLDWKAIEELSGVKRIKWTFNPPTGAWWGGFWERLVREVKNLLRRMLGKARLTYDQLRTCIAGVASTLNDRPLTVMTEDANDFVALTPAMFMRNRAIGHLPETEKAESLTAAYKKMKSLQAQLQDRFRKEYLSLLVQRGNEKRTADPQEGDIVLVGADNKKRFEWPLGRIVELIPGKDGMIRVARVKTKNGLLTRPLQRLYPLEVSNGNLPSPKRDIPVTAEKQRKSKDVIVTRAGRVVSKPARYGQCISFVV